MKLNAKWMLGLAGLGMTVGATAVLAGRAAYAPPPAATVQQALSFDPFNPTLTILPSAPAVATPTPVTPVATTPAASTPAAGSLPPTLAPAPVAAARPIFDPPPRSPFLPSGLGPILP